MLANDDEVLDSSIAVSLATATPTLTHNAVTTVRLVPVIDNRSSSSLDIARPDRTASAILLSDKDALHSKDQSSFIRSVDHMWRSRLIRYCSRKPAPSQGLAIDLITKLVVVATQFYIYCDRTDSLVAA